MSTPSSTPSSSTPPASSWSRATPADSASASAQNCPRCARAIPANAVLGACPHCLLAAGLTSEPAAPANAAPPPTVAELAPEFPQLELIELLGRGGMGAVYKARQKSLDRLVALKLLRPGLDADPSFAERFTREARALAQLNHPGIVTLYEFGRTPGGLFFILMEFVDGLNLRQLLAAGRLSPREALAIIPPLCDALQYAHDRGLVHRDIKPENLLIDRLGRVKIADFGLAKLAATSASSASPGNASPADTKSSSDSGIGHWSLVTDHSGLTETGKIMGTPEYMAPEQRERPATVDHRADIYALGVVLYQMLTGELPDPKQLQPPSHRVQLDIRLDEIVLRALEANPALRYSAASELKTQLETVASSSPPPPPPPGAPTSPSASAASTAVPTSPARSAPPPFRVSAIFSRPRLKFWLLRVAPLSLLALLALRFFVIAPYRIDTSSVEPEIPASSLAFVYKLDRHFSPGDIIAYHHSESLTYVARVTAAGPVDGKISITRKNQSPTPISADAIIGKVVFNTRSSSTSEHATPAVAAKESLKSTLSPDLPLSDNRTSENIRAAEEELRQRAIAKARLDMERRRAERLAAQRADDTLSVIKDQVAAAERQLKILQDRHQAGLATAAEVSAAKTRLAVLKTEFDTITSSRKTATAPANSAPLTPSSSKAEPTDLRAARADLADARNRYMDSHPKVAALQLRINELERLAREGSPLIQKPKPADPSSPVPAVLAPARSAEEDGALQTPRVETIIIQENGTCLIDSHLFSLDQLNEHFAVLSRQPTPPEIHIKTSEKAAYKFLEPILEAARRNRLNRIELDTRSELLPSDPIPAPTPQ